MTGRGLLSQLHPRHIRWWQWLLLTFVGLFFFLRSWLPEFLRQQILTQLGTATPAHVQLRDVDLDLLNGRVTLQGLSFLLDGDSQPALVIDDLTTKMSLRALLRREIQVEDIHVTGVQLHAVHEANGQLNLSRLFLPSPSQAEPPSSALPSLSIQRIRIAESQWTYRDRTVSPEAQFDLVIETLQSAQISLQANGLAAPVEVQLKGALNSSPVDGKAEVQWQREQTKINAQIETQQLALAAIEPYLRNVLTVEKITGQLGANVQYRYHVGTQLPQHSLAGILNVSHLQFVEAGSDQSALTVPEGRIDLGTLSFSDHYISVKSIELKEPKLSLVHRDKGLNVAAWVRTAHVDADASSSQIQSSPPWQFSISTIKWTGGELVYRNNNWPKKEEISLHPEEIIVSNLDDRMLKLPFQFRTRIGGGKMAGEGTIWFALPQKQEGAKGSVATILAMEPAPSVRGKFWPFAKLQIALQANDLEVAAVQPLLSPVLAAKQVQGKISGDLNTVLSERDDSQVAQVHGTLVTKNFSISDTPERGNTLSWEEGTISIPDGSSFWPFSLYLNPNLSHVRLQRPEQGDLTMGNATGNLRIAHATPAAGTQPTTIAGTLDTTKLALHGLPAVTNVLAWDSAHINILEGSTVSPLALHFKPQIAQLSVRHLPQGDVAIEKASGDFRLTQEMSEQQTSVLKAHGPVEFTGFALTQGEEKQILLGCYQGKATVSEGSRLAPFDIKLRDVALAYAYAQGLRSPGGQFQLFIPSTKEQSTNTVPVPAAQAETDTVPGSWSFVTTFQSFAPFLSPPESQSSTPSLSIQLDRVTVIGGQLYFEDRTVTPPQTVYWQDVRVDLNQAGYPVLLPAAFSAHAYNEDGAPVEFKGRTERKGQQTVVRVHGKIEKMSLSRFNSYLEPSLGYRVKKGAVSATWDLVLPGDRVQANMKVTLHDINLGGKQATSNLERQVGLPLALVLALLKDLNGDINLQLPVEGSVNEPGFAWSGTVVRAVRDVLIGAVSSPLKVLGALFKGENKLEGFTLEPIRFVSGTTQIADTGKEQLSRLAVFLTQRPMIDLRFAGVTGPEDVEGVRHQEILKQLSLPAVAREKESVASPQSPLQEEVRKFLSEEQPIQGRGAASALSPQATEMLEQLRKHTKVTPEMTKQLATARVQTVLSELTIQHAVAPGRLHISPEKQRGAGRAEVRYTIQTRAE